MAGMSSIHDLPTPALLLDLDVLEDNLRSMQRRTGQLSVALRPHLKTHKCVEIAMAQRALGCAGVTVSTLYEAGVFADHGFDDITWAFPMPPDRAEDVARLARRVRLGVVVDSDPPLEALALTGVAVRVWLKIDCGYGRAGIRHDAPELVPLASRIVDSPTLEFAGILSHSGNAYSARSPMDARRIGELERSRMVEAVARLGDAGIEVAEVSTGSTPTMAHVANLDGVTEVRPGNYSLYDYTQVALGSCSARNVAASVLATVVSPSGPGRSVIDAGALAMSLDRGPKHGIRPGFGRLYEDYARGTLRHNATVASVSQEHGILDISLAVGQRVRILPNHSCLTVACFDEFQVVRGEEVIDNWKIWRGR